MFAQPNLRIVTPLSKRFGTARATRGRTPIGQILVDAGALDPGDLLRALALQAREDVPLGHILLTHNMVSEAALYDGLSRQWDARLADLTMSPPDVRLIDEIGAATCIRGAFVPWIRVGGATVIACARPAEFAEMEGLLRDTFGPVLMAIAPEQDILDALLKVRKSHLTQRAETLVEEDESCRRWHTRKLQLRVATFAICLATVGILSFNALVAMILAWTLLTFYLAAAMKIGAATMQIRDLYKYKHRPRPNSKKTSIARLPVVSIMVPLFKEKEIANHLVRRMRDLNYPRELLDVCIVIEGDDETTKATIAATDLPRWIRPIEVPAGSIRTKPRAMNYALSFCRGSIIGVYDAEDAPHPDQIHTVVQRFHERSPQVACLQGMLDYYNARTNWLSRCFAIEYATWFRVVLPGIQKLGFALPLGGTTLFFRREALEKLGGWDAHNVTEDADLGIRLVRHGYRTEIIETVTQEEANCRPWAWIKQRSRWNKGYAITWAVHMRDPVKLYRDLGAWKFFGVQVLFGATLSQFVLAPVLWSFWLLMFDVAHPFKDILPQSVLIGIGISLFLTELIQIAIGVFAVWGTQHRRLAIFVPTLQLYFPLGVAAVYKGLFELFTCPFYWDKTEHGVFNENNSGD